MKGMNLQDFACACSDLMWGGELGWDRENGLNLLFDVIREKVNKRTEKQKEITMLEVKGQFPLSEEEQLKLLEERPLYIIESLAVENEKVDELLDYLTEFKHPLVGVHIKHTMDIVDNLVFVYLRFSCKRKDAMFSVVHRDMMFQILEQQFGITNTWDLAGEFDIKEAMAGGK